MLKLGEAPKGIIGSGWTVSKPYLDQNRYFVDFEFDALSESPVLSLSELRRLSSFHWLVQGSGIEIPDETTMELEKAWSKKKGMPVRPFIVETDSSIHYPEGAVERITINAYERKSAARRDCIAFYGTACYVCKFKFSEFYGSGFADFIHVHHLIPLSTLGRGYRINPVLHLRPICPNCHAVIHSTQPPRTIEQVREMFRKHGSAPDKAL